jgi:pilus assembly protein CpaB
MSSGISLLVAVVFGAIAVFLVRGMVQNTGGANAPVSRTIVVASEPVMFGAALGPENLREIPWPAAEALPGSFTSISDVTQDGRRLALVKLGRNEPILASKVTAPNQRATLSTQIDEGMRAVTIRVDEVRGVAGFVLPGDRVDVILTRGEGGGQEAAAYADLLLQNANVLAIDQLANERQDKPAIARAVTLEVTVQEAQKVVLAQGVGRLSLVLRQAGEVDARPARRVTASDLGLAESAPRDRVADLEKQLDEMTKAAEAARAQEAGNAIRRMSDLEGRMNEIANRANGPPLLAPAPAERKATSPNLVVNVIRNGAKTEQYTVSSERQPR